MTAKGGTRTGFDTVGDGAVVVVGRPVVNRATVDATGLSSLSVTTLSLGRRGRRATNTASLKRSGRNKGDARKNERGEE